VRERKIEFAPARDKRHPDPKQNYGIHGVEIRFLLGDQNGMIQFVIFTNWMLDCMMEFSGSFLMKPGPPRGDYNWFPPMAADLGYHSPVPQHEGHEPLDHACPVLNGTCYYDGSGLNANRVFHVLLNEGSDGVWREMEAEYERVFGSQEVAS
jgi:hypothetical protein